MNTTMSMEQLKEAVEPLVLFGELIIEGKKSKRGFEIKVLEHEEGQLVDLNDKVVDENYSSTACITTIHTDSTGEVNFIEHPFGAFTQKNKDVVPILLNLVGQRIDIKEIRSEN